MNYALLVNFSNNHDLEMLQIINLLLLSWCICFGKFWTFLFAL